MAETHEGFTLGLDGLRTMEPDKRSARVAAFAIPMLNIVATIVRDTSDEYVPPLLYELLDEAQRWIRAAEVAEKTGRDVALVEAPARPSAEFASIVESLVGYAAPSPEQHVGFMAAVRLREQLEREAAV